MKILFLTNLLPYPLDNGGKVKSYTTINALATAGNQIDLVCFTEQQNIDNKNQDEMLKFCNVVKQVYLRLTTAENRNYMIKIAAKSLLSTYSFGVLKYCSKEMKLILIELCSNNDYDCIYFDHLQMCVYKKMISQLLPNAKCILDEHNCEALIMSRNAMMSSNFIKKLFLKLESKKLSTFESFMLQQMDINIVLSQEDYFALKRQCKKDFRHEIIPIGVQDRGEKAERNADGIINILFLGTLTWEPNNQGMIWFLTNVIPLLEKKKFQYKLYIVGKNPSKDVKKLAEKYNNIVVTGYVESVDKYYDVCDCMIVPLFIGSGQRVKLIEGFSKSMPAVSTSVGAEGLDVENGRNIIIADTVEDFAKAIINFGDIQLRKEISAGARSTYELNYSTEAINKRLNSVINKEDVNARR